MQSLNDISDEALMLRYIDGSAESFTALYQRHKAPLYRFVVRSCKSEALAEEIYQDIWANIVDGRHRYKASAKFSTWLYRIASNRLVDQYRKQGKWDDYLVEGEDHACALARSFEQPEQQADINQQIQQLFHCLEQLPAPQLQVFLLKEEAGLSLNAIAAAIGAGKEAAKSRMRYALNKLRQCMGGK